MNDLQKIYALFLQSTGICTDTRKLKKGQLYIALHGANFNGNTFAKQAIAQGAITAIIDDTSYNTENTIVVTDTLKTLQDLANYHRRQLSIPIIALTGSNGKTTTKELIFSVLKKKYNTSATQGNFNNHIGVPLTLLSFNSETEIGVVEMGANHPKEIAALCKIAAPDFGYITNFGKAHLEGFKSLEGVIKAKSELYDYLIENKGIIFVDAENTTQVAKVKNHDKTIYFSENTNTKHQIALHSANPYVVVLAEKTKINSHLIGHYNFKNIAAAVTIGKYFNIPITTIKQAIESYVPANNRSQIIERNSNTIILDAYNANPTSMRAAIDNLTRLDTSNKIAFLGDMLEVGEKTNQEHLEIAKHAVAMGITVFFIGTLFYKLPDSYDRFLNYTDIKAYLQKHPIKNSTILIKGSRGMALERIVEDL